MEEVCPRPCKRKKVKGQHEEDLKDIPIVMINHELSDEELSEHLGDKWKCLPDETPVSLRKDGRSAGTKSYMWAYRTGEMNESSAIVLYEYQKTLD